MHFGTKWNIKGSLEEGNRREKSCTYNFKKKEIRKSLLFVLPNSKVEFVIFCDIHVFSSQSPPQRISASKHEMEKQADEVSAL